MWNATTGLLFQLQARGLSHEAVIEILVALLGLMIAVLAVIAGLIAILIAFVSFIGFQTIREEAKKSAEDVAVQVAQKTAKSEATRIAQKAVAENMDRTQAIGMAVGVTDTEHPPTKKTGKTKATSDRTLKQD